MVFCLGHYINFTNCVIQIVKIPKIHKCMVVSFTVKGILKLFSYSEKKKRTTCRLLTPPCFCRSCVECPSPESFSIHPSSLNSSQKLSCCTHYIHRHRQHTHEPNMNRQSSCVFTFSMQVL